MATRFPKPPKPPKPAHKRTHTPLRKKNRGFLPAYVYRPEMLLWTWTLPMLLQLFWNMWHFLDALGFTSTSQAEHIEWQLGLNLINLGASVFAYKWAKGKKGKIPRKRYFQLLGYQWLLLATVAGFVGDRGFNLEFMRENPALMSIQYPAYLISLVHVILMVAALPPKSQNPQFLWTKTLAWATLAFVGSGFLLFTYQRNFHSFGWISRSIVFAPAIAFYIMLARTILIPLRSVDTKFLTSSIFALIFPICGMGLNITIPFPANLQTPGMWGFLLLSCLALLPTSVKRPAIRKTQFLVISTCFPFSLYFLLIFLPILPIAPYMIALLGAGLLVLSPAALFCVHLHRLREGYLEFAKPHKKGKLIMASTILLLPSLFLIKAETDRYFLMKGINFILTPDLENSTATYTGNPSLTIRALDAYTNDLTGTKLPYLRGLRSSITTGNLVLREHKRERIQAAFTGHGWLTKKEMLESISKHNPAPPAFDRQVVMSIASIQQSPVIEEPGLLRTEVELELLNQGQQGNEFLTTLQVPEGVYISGYALDVLGERVSGQMYERKAAKWVYQNIRDFQRKDPGLLSYKSPTELTLRIFPFAEAETRRTWIEFLHPADWQPPIRIGGETLALPAPSGSTQIHVATTKSGTLAILPAELRKNLPTLRREPYYHFNIDRSLFANPTQTSLDENAQDATESLPKASQFTYSLANYQYLQGEGLHPLEDIAHLHTYAQKLHPSGGFLKTQAHARSIHAYRKNFLDSTDPALARMYPIYRDIQYTYRPTTEKQPIQELEQRWIPENFSGSVGKPAPVILLRKGESIRPLGVESKPENSLALHFEDKDPRKPLEVYDPVNQSWKPLNQVTQHAPNSLYADAAKLQLQSTAADLNPAKRQAWLNHIANKSKELNILTRLASFIVVENKAQWKALRDANHLSLQNHSALALGEETFMENPEPPIWLTGLLILLVGSAIQRVRRGNENP